MNGKFGNEMKPSNDYYAVDYGRQAEAGPDQQQMLAAKDDADFFSKMKPYAPYEAP
jgi:hypothetical protein